MPVCLRICVYMYMMEQSFTHPPCLPPSVCRWLSCVVRQGESGGGTRCKECSKTSVELNQVKVALSLMTCHCLSLVHARGRNDQNSKDNINIKTARQVTGPHETKKENKTKYSLVQWTFMIYTVWNVLRSHPSQTYKCVAYYPLSRATGCSRCADDQTSVELN